MIRVHGDIRRINLPEMSSEEVGQMITSVMNDQPAQALSAKHGNRLCFRAAQCGALPCERLHLQPRPGRRVPYRAQHRAHLGRLESPAHFPENRRHTRAGLVLVTGPTGSGKSTTLAAMIDYINNTHPSHILTIEDPIEFVHQSKKALVNQRELHEHTHSFANALRSALREDPDVILVGEMRDPETIGLALTAAETGHLVFGTLHTTGAAKTVDRIVDVFPAGEKEMVRSMLSESLRAVISQTLLKTRDGSGRVAAHEILISTPAVRNLIRENKIAQIGSVLQTGQNSRHANARSIFAGAGAPGRDQPRCGPQQRATR
jgi:twitching motility protein PilT